MKQYKYNNIKILYIFICLRILQQYNKNNKYILNNFKHKAHITNLEDIAYIQKYNYTNILSIIDHVMCITYKYNTVNMILKYQSTIPIMYNNKKFNKLYDQYIKKFIYKHQQYHNNNIKKQNNKNSIYNIGIMQVYTLYKILHTKHKFIAYKYLYKK